MAEVASAFVSIMPSARGFGAKLDSQIGGDISGSGKKSGAVWGKVFAGAAALGVGALLKGTVGLEAQFSQTMNTIGAVTDVSAEKLANLSDLALKMGKDTSFSASEASDAMLELAKGGMTAAAIQAGGLAGTLKLAAAGGTSMETAATIASNAMNAFSLKGKDMSAVANALAGGANASSASVESLGEALSQVGPGAVNAGLSIQDTVATLSAFDAAGIKGSDAGTSLKTMLARLIPVTAKAKDYMDRYGLSFVKPNGEFKDMTVVAQELKDGLGGLSEAERSRALNTIFGSDASRAAAVLMKEGEQGIRGFIKATQDQDAAQRVADARMKGTAGAIEQFKGSIETAQIELGLLFAPAIQAGLAKLTAGVNAFGPALEEVLPAIKGFVADMRAGTGVGGFLAAVLSRVGGVLKVLATFVAQNKTAVATFVGIIGTAILVTKAWRAAQLALNFVLAANPIGLVVVAVAALAAGLVMAYRRSETFRNIVNTSFAAVRAAAQSVATFVTSTVPQAFASAAAAVVKSWNSVKDGARTALTYIQGIPGAIVAVFSGAGTLLYNAGTQLMSGLAAGIRAKIADAINEVQAGLSKIRGLLPGSPIKWGPLKNWNNGGAGKRLMDLVARGIMAATPKTVKAAQSAFEKIGDSLKSQRDKLRSTLAGLKSDFASLADSVSSSFLGDLFNPPEGTSFVDNLFAKRAQLAGLLASFKTLKGWGLDPSFLSQLFASGNGALITELAGMGQTGAIGAASLFGEVSNLGNQLGQAVANNDPVAMRVDETNRQLELVNRQLEFLGSDIGRELNQAASKARRTKQNRGKK